jgi:hypothetical protein
MDWSKIKNQIYFASILLLIIVILLQKCGNGDKVVKTDTIRTVDTSYVTVDREIPTYIPKWRTRVEHDTIYDVDTSYVLGDYFSTYIYNDSLINDTLKLYINDSITQNKIKSRDLKYKLTIPIITITNTVVENKREYYIGAGITGGKSGLDYLGPEFLFRNTNRQACGLGIGLNRQFKPTVSLKFYWKLDNKK